MTDAKKLAVYLSVTVACGAVVGLVGFFVSDPGHAGTVSLNLDCVRDHLGEPIGKLDMLIQCEETTKAFMTPIASLRTSRTVPVAMTASTDIPRSDMEKDMREIRSQVLGSDHATDLGPNKYDARQVESSPVFQHALELTRRVLEPQRPDSLNAFNNVPAAMEKAVVDLTNKVFSPELKQTIKAINEFAVKLGDVGKGATAELLKMDANDLKRHLFAATVAVAASISSKTATFRRGQLLHACPPPPPLFPLLPPNQRCGSMVREIIPNHSSVLHGCTPFPHASKCFRSSCMRLRFRSNLSDVRLKKPLAM